MHHYVYEVVNQVNGKVYVGKHSTENIDDGYMGSGTALSAAIKKYGIENFRKRIIKECASEDEALELERDIVNAEFVADHNTYNLVVGGKGSWNKVAQSNGGKSVWANEANRQRLISQISERNRHLHEEGVLSSPDWTGRRHTDATKRKIGETNSVRQRGQRNSQFGTCWIKELSTGESKKIPRSELDLWEKLGWVRGRITVSDRKKRS